MLRACSLLADGRLAVLDGEYERGLQSAVLAVAEFNGLGAPFEAATARLVVADAYAASGRSAQAEFERRTARDTFESFGAELWAARVDQLIAPGAAEQQVASPDAQVAGSGESTAVFRRDGDTRTVGWGASTVVVRDLKGLRYLDHLLAEPGREFHAAQLVHLETGEQAAIDVGIPVLDETAKRAYRRRLAEIDDDIEVARADNDLARVELAERDRDYLVAELTRASGLGGRDRTVHDDAERARVSVTRSIRYALDRLAERSPDVAAHLRRHVSTGTYCSYQPDGLHPVRWET
jgi:hypothetical protein